ncbi:unnamed protein product [Arabidopsis thaliana]|nr:unnamed protein product [Arabidopsis thaliana]
MPHQDEPVALGVRKAVEHPDLKGVPLLLSRNVRRATMLKRVHHWLVVFTGISSGMNISTIQKNLFSSVKVREGLALTTNFVKRKKGLGKSIRRNSDIARPSVKISPDGHHYTFIQRFPGGLKSWKKKLLGFGIEGRGLPAGKSCLIAFTRFIKTGSKGPGFWQSLNIVSLAPFKKEDRRAGRTDCLIPRDGMERSYRTPSNRTKTAGNATGWMSTGKNSLGLEIFTTGDQELARLDGEHEKEGAV